MRFPQISAHTLSGRAVEFPAEVLGKPAVLCVAFRQGAQRIINDWFPPLLGELVGRQDLNYFEIPMISLGFKPVSRWIEGGMRGGVPGDLHDRTATAFSYRGGFCRALAITDRRVPHFFVLSAAGEIVHREQGAATIDAVGGIRAALGRLGIGDLPSAEG